MGTTACTSEHGLLCRVAWPCSLADAASMDGQGRLILLVCCSQFAVDWKVLTTRISAALKTVSPGSINLAGVWDE